MRLHFFNDNTGFWEALAAIGTLAAVAVAVLGSFAARKDAREARGDAKEARRDAEAAREREHWFAELTARAQIGALLDVVPVPPFRGGSTRGTVGFRVTNLGHGTATHLEARVEWDGGTVAPITPEWPYIPGAASSTAPSQEFSFRLPEQAMTQDADGRWVSAARFVLSYHDRVGPTQVDHQIDPRPVLRYGETARVRIAMKGVRVDGSPALRVVLTRHEEARDISLGPVGARLLVPESWGEPHPIDQSGQDPYRELWWRREFADAEFPHVPSWIRDLLGGPLAVWERDIAAARPFRDGDEHYIWFRLPESVGRTFRVHGEADDGEGRAMTSFHTGVIPEPER